MRAPDAEGFEFQIRISRVGVEPSNAFHRQPCAHRQKQQVKLQLSEQVSHVVRTRAAASCSRKVLGRTPIVRACTSCFSLDANTISWWSIWILCPPAFATLPLDPAIVS